MHFLQKEKFFVYCIGTKFCDKVTNCVRYTQHIAWDTPSILCEIHPAYSVRAEEQSRLLADLTEHGFSRRLFGEHLSWHTQYNDQATGWMIQGLFPGRSNSFYRLQMSNPSVAPTQPIKLVLGLFSLEANQVGREADH